MIVAKVLPDVPAIEREFDYEVPETMVPHVRVGTIVRVDLHGRRVGGWVTELGESGPEGIALKPLAKVSGYGPDASVIALARWAAWRYVGRPQAFLGTASPPNSVRFLGAKGSLTPPSHPIDNDARQLVGMLANEARAGRSGAILVRRPPNADPLSLVAVVAAAGSTLVVTPSVEAARLLSAQLRRSGKPVALWPIEWASAAAGGHVIVGARSAVWATAPDLNAVVVFDEHDEGHQQEQAPTWHARDVAIERARMLGIPCILTSPTPSLEALGIAAHVIEPSRVAERAGWPLIDVIDRRRDDPVTGLFSPRIVATLRSAERVLCVLNRTGRAKLVVCANQKCGEIARCEKCAAPVAVVDAGLGCPRCATTRPKVCTVCGGMAMRALRAGVTRVREELAALANREVVEVTGSQAFAPGANSSTALFVGTEAVLHRIPAADAVIFLDFDQELLAPRYRAAEQAFGLLVRAARLVGPRASGGRVTVQTRYPRHEALVAALHADPQRFATAELIARREIGHPPTCAQAAISGPSAAAFIARLNALDGAVGLGALDGAVGLGAPEHIEVREAIDGGYLVRASTHRVLCDALGAVARPPGRLRIEMDPLRV